MGLGESGALGLWGLGLGSRTSPESRIKDLSKIGMFLKVLSFSPSESTLSLFFFVDFLDSTFSLLASMSLLLTYSFKATTSFFASIFRSIRSDYCIHDCIAFSTELDTALTCLLIVSNILAVSTVLKLYGCNFFNRMLLLPVVVYSFFDMTGVVDCLVLCILP